MNHPTTSLAMYSLATYSFVYTPNYPFGDDVSAWDDVSASPAPSYAGYSVSGRRVEYRQTHPWEKVFDEAELLEDDRDCDGAVKPHPSAIAAARRAVNDLTAHHAPIADVGPGVRGEMYVYLKHPNRNSKAVHLYFYPQQAFFLLVSDTHTAPQHGDYAPDVIPQLLQWLND